MSLNWDITKVRDTDSLYHKYDDKDNIIEERKDRLGMFLDPLIWASIGVDMRNITEDNIDEWLFRFEARRQAGLSCFSRKDVMITRPILERFIGLEVNVRTTTRRQFLARLCRDLARNVDGAMRKQYRGKRK